MANDSAFSKVLVAIDRSTESMAAVDKAIRIAKNDNAELIAFKVIQLPVVGYYTPRVLDSVLDKGTAEADSWIRVIEKRVQQRDGTRMKKEIVRSFGSPP